ncbi:hypothetical protein DFS34DRAFT_291885 [Phlyctochytrium arcticum]|nr:hypothetical protein DFS34DRAFT_291885 [Phlyctochytrium arcticum]
MLPNLLCAPGLGQSRAAASHRFYCLLSAVALRYHQLHQRFNDLLLRQVASKRLNDSLIVIDFFRSSPNILRVRRTVPGTVVPPIPIGDTIYTAFNRIGSDPRVTTRISPDRAYFIREATHEQISNSLNPKANIKISLSKLQGLSSLCGSLCSFGSSR